MDDIGFGARYRRLVRAGKPTNVVCVAIARELAARDRDE